MTVEAGVVVESLGVGAIIEDLDTGVRGVVVSDESGSYSSPDKEAVVWEGSDEAVRLETNRNRVLLGTYENHIANPEKCGLGMGKLGCKYLTLEGSTDYTCQRFSDLRPVLLRSAETLIAQATPAHLFPGCQEDIQTGIANALPVPE